MHLDYGQASITASHSDQIFTSSRPHGEGSKVKKLHQKDYSTMLQIIKFENKGQASLNLRDSPSTMPSLVLSKEPETALSSFAVLTPACAPLCLPTLQPTSQTTELSHFELSNLPMQSPSRSAFYISFQTRSLAPRTTHISLNLQLPTGTSNGPTAMSTARPTNGPTQHSSPKPTAKPSPIIPRYTPTFLPSIIPAKFPTYSVTPSINSATQMPTVTSEILRFNATQVLVNTSCIRFQQSALAQKIFITAVAKSLVSPTLPSSLNIQIIVTSVACYNSVPSFSPTAKIIPVSLKTNRNRQLLDTTTSTIYYSVQYTLINTITNTLISEFKEYITSLIDNSISDGNFTKWLRIIGHQNGLNSLEWIVSQTAIQTTKPVIVKFMSMKPTGVPTYAPQNFNQTSSQSSSFSFLNMDGTQISIVGAFVCLIIFVFCYVFIYRIRKGLRILPCHRSKRIRAIGKAPTHLPLQNDRISFVGAEKFLNMREAQKTNSQRLVQPVSSVRMSMEIFSQIMENTAEYIGIMEQNKKLAQQLAADGKLGALDLSLNDIYDWDNRKSKVDTFNMPDKARRSLEIYKVESKEYKSRIVSSGNHEIHMIDEVYCDDEDSAADLGIGMQNPTSPEQTNHKKSALLIEKVVI